MVSLKTLVLFSEHAGYKRKPDSNENVPYEIPTSLLTEYDSVFPNVTLGEVIFFI